MIGLSALVAAITTDVEQAKNVEDKMYNAKVNSGEIPPTPHKRTDGHHHDHDDASPKKDAAEPKAEPDHDSGSPDRVASKPGKAVRE